MEYPVITKALTNLVEQANKEHSLATDNAKHLKKAMSIQMRHVITLGKLLEKAKSKCQYGEWEGLFVESDRGFKDGLNPRFAFGKEHARIFMKAAKYPNQAKLFAGEMEVFRLKDVYSSLSDATEEKEQEIALLGQHSLNEDDEYNTPAEYIESARKVMGSIDCDPASNDIAQETVQAGIYYTIDNSGLEQPWTDNVWLNPPYSRIINDFAEMLVKQ